jgi:hypothetical protein
MDSCRKLSLVSELEPSLKRDEYFQKNNALTLFQTKAWHSAWFDTWASTLNTAAKFQVDETKKVYFAKHRVKKFLPVRTLIPFGQGGPGLRSIRSEYFQPPEYNADWLTNLILANRSEALISDIPANSPHLTTLMRSAKQHSQSVFERDRATAYSVDTQTDTFQSYTSALGSNTRLKLINRRKRLEAEGTVDIENLWPNVDGFIELLNSFHIERWGKPCYQGKNLEFIKRLLVRLPDEGHTVNLSVLKLDTKPVSLLLDITVGERTYNLQGGFIESLVKGVSLGTLHFGYAIEAAFSDPNINTYDFMAGEGKNSNYKEKIANQTSDLLSLVVVKSPILKFLYSLKKEKLSE